MPCGLHRAGKTRVLAVSERERVSEGAREGGRARRRRTGAEEVNRVERQARVGVHTGRCSTKLERGSERCKLREMSERRSSADAPRPPVPLRPRTDEGADRCRELYRVERDPATVGTRRERRCGDVRDARPRELDEHHLGRAGKRIRAARAIARAYRAVLAAVRAGTSAVRGGSRCRCSVSPPGGRRHDRNLFCSH